MAGDPEVLLGGGSRLRRQAGLEAPSGYWRACVALIDGLT